MSKGTTGAYGDFPDYYYKAGNQFGAYLLGKTPSTSWDLRADMEALGPQHAPIIRARPPGSIKPSGDALEYIRSYFSTGAIRHLALTLAAARAVDVRHLVDGDPTAALARVLDSLSPPERRRVLDRLRRVVDAASSGRPSATRRVNLNSSDSAPRPRTRRRTKQKRKVGGAEALGSRHQAVKRQHPVRSQPLPKTSPTPAACAICDVQLSLEEQSLWSRHRDLFLSHGYCTEHGTKLLKALGTAPGRDDSH